MRGLDRHLHDLDSLGCVPAISKELREWRRRGHRPSAILATKLFRKVMFDEFRHNMARVWGLEPDPEADMVIMGVPVVEAKLKGARWQLVSYRPWNRVEP